MDNDVGDDDFGHDGHFHSMAAGAAYALYRQGQDQQTQQLINALGQPQQIHVHLDEEDQKGVAPVNALDYSTAPMPQNWSDYVGQEPLKRRLSMEIGAAQARGEALPHVLLASGRAGVGKTTMARLIAKTMCADIIEMVPPFNIWTLSEAAQSLYDHDVLFIDEIHILANNGKRGAELLLKVLEDKTLFLPDGDVIKLNDITIIGATTDPDKLPETILDRFKIKPYFQAYSLSELGLIAVEFADRHDCLDYVSPAMAVTFAQACRGTPRVLEEMVLACRTITLSLGAVPTPEQVLEFVEVEPDGLTRTHVHYITAMFQYFPRQNNNHEIEYIAGEATMQQILRETKQGIGRVERFLIEEGLLDRTPRGRRLTDRGIARAMEFIAAGKGASDIG